MKKAKERLKKRDLPFLKFLKDRDKLRFDGPENYHVPLYIKENLKHTLRSYQNQALRFFHYTQTMEGADYRQNHLLFNMATGSGKTDVMAGIILYLFEEFNYQNFLFVVNTNGVVLKTRENLINQNSSKYLFKKDIEIEGNRISIQEVNRFPKNATNNTIYIRLATIQSISNELNYPKENGLTYDELEKNSVVILGDEAHHFNAFTKSNLSAEEKMEQSWENTLDRIRQLNIKNRQIEFTATIDIEGDNNVYEKYKDKIVYQYGLDSFIREGFSKRVFRLQANSDDKSKMLNAVLLSQYRKYLSKKYGVTDFKPIVMFKSNYVKVSINMCDNFITMIKDLNVEDLQRFIQTEFNTTVSPTLKSAYEYYLTKDLAHIIVDLKRDFSKERIINVNDGKKGILENSSNFKSLNTLEEQDNPFRVIFAVAKLSEGWDVLNLYDIVRISESAKATPVATMSEAQLIGRGARYNPFKFEGKYSFARRFDNTVNEELKLLESLHYHTMNDPNYIKNLVKSLDSIKLSVEDDSDFDIYSTDIKSSFKRSEAYKTGKLYYNMIEDVPQETYTSLAGFGVKLDEVYTADLISITTEAEFVSKERQVQIRDELITRDIRLFKKAMDRNSFFKFSNLKEYMPTLKSKNEFINDKRWLGKVRIQARIANESNKLTKEQELHAIEMYLKYLEKTIKKNYCKKRGTNIFKSVLINQVVQPYRKKVSKGFSGISIHEKVLPYSMKGKDWFVFENAIVNGLEKSLIDLMSNFIKTLQKKYKKVYLIRNDEQSGLVKLHQFSSNSGIAVYDGFMPDFILYLEGEGYIYQVYIEPKGDNLLERDKWKEELLLSLNNEKIEFIGEDEKVKLFGLKFYTNRNTRQIEKDLSELVFDGNDLMEEFYF
ncbi:DEAD/DEAH box helicase family protein [Clostridioides sp. ZZV14-6387]|uniref:DEAD/DEAH box helicase family protein n=1 Tax=Clostridioides sp. ZZV14-6387 TaxID=2811497 RepID=UPI001D119125|nr:DEAD/DEAH box helicase family protein [Clostridioides sp. ZZV14-6387]